MAVGPSNKVRSGKLKRTTIDPRIGGTKGDAGPAGKAGAKGLGTAGGARSRTKIDPRIGGQKGDAGPAGKAKPLSGFGKAFSVALAKGPGTIFTFKGKKYKAAKKHEMKGPSASRVEDKSISAASSVKGKRDTTKSKAAAAAGAGAQIGYAAAGVKLVDKVLSKKKAKTPASGRFGQRKAGGIMKASDGKSVIKPGVSAQKAERVMKQAKKMAGEDRMTMQDLREAAENLGYKVTKDTRNPAGKRTGGVMKAFLGKFMVKQGIKTLTKNQKEMLMKMSDKQRSDILKKYRKSAKAEQVPRLNKKRVAAAIAIPSAVILNTTKKGKGKEKAKARRKEDKVSQADIIGKGSKKGRRAGGIMKANTGKMANKDYDGDGRIESSTAEYMGSRDKAIKQSKKLRGGGAAIRGNNFKGIF